MSQLSLETVVVRRAEPLTASVDGELVMLDPRRSEYFAIDSIGSRIWELLERPLAVGQVCSKLEDEFDVAPQTCRADVLAFLEELRRAELLDVG